MARGKRYWLRKWRVLWSWNGNSKSNEIIKELNKTEEKVLRNQLISWIQQVTRTIKDYLIYLKIIRNVIIDSYYKYVREHICAPIWKLIKGHYLPIWIKSTGSIYWLFCLISRWRCGPRAFSDSAVSPIEPITVPALTVSPSLTVRVVPRLQYFATIPLPWSIVTVVPSKTSSLMDFTVPLEIDLTGSPISPLMSVPLWVCQILVVSDSTGSG